MNQAEVFCNWEGSEEVQKKEETEEDEDVQRFNDELNYYDD